MSNIKIEENRKLNALKHLYQCSKGKFKIRLIYQNKDYTLFQIKERNFIDKFKLKLNKPWTVYTHTQTEISTYIYIYIQNIIKNIQTTNTSKLKSHWKPIN